MPVTAKIKFTQGLLDPPAGEALVGVVAVNVVCTNENNSDVSEFTWEVIDRPPTSTVPLGIGAVGLVPTFNFTPDVAGGYLIHLHTRDIAGNAADDFRVFQVPEPSGHIIPPFDALASALNFGGQTRGWAKSQEELLRFLLTGGGGGSYGLFSARPAASNAGRIYTSSDGLVQFVDDGTAWRPIIPGGAPGTQPPAASAFTPVQATGLTNAAALIDDKGTLLFSWTGSGSAGSAEPVRFAYKAAPAAGATGYRITAHFVFLTPTQNGAAYSHLVGVGFRDSATGNVELLEAANVVSGNPFFRLHRRRYTASDTSAAPTFTFSAQVIGSPDTSQATDIWVRVERTNAGDRAFYVSMDGLHWKRWTSADSSGDAFIAPDQVFLESCIFGDAGDGLCGAICDSYLEEAY